MEKDLPEDRDVSTASGSEIPATADGVARALGQAEANRAKTSRAEEIRRGLARGEVVETTGEGE